MKKTKMAVLVLSALVGTTSLSTVFADEGTINVVVNGQSVDFTGDQSPVIKNGRVLVPFRAVFEKMGANVKWFDDIKLCEATYASATVGIEIGSNTVIVGEGATVESDVPAEIINGRTMVPLRVLSESIGAEVSWDNDSKTATVTTPKITGEPPASLEYKMNNSGIVNMDTGIGLNYEYPVVTTEYTFKDKLNNLIENNVRVAMENAVDEYGGENTNITAVCQVTYNDAGIFSISCKIDNEEVYKGDYGISNGALINEGLPNIPDDANDTFKIENYTVEKKADDGYNYIIATAAYPVFLGDDSTTASLNTQLQNSAKKAVDSFIASYDAKSLEIYSNPPTHLFEPPYNFSVGCEVELEGDIATITNHYYEVKYDEGDKYYDDVIKVNIKTGEVIE